MIIVIKKWKIIFKIWDWFILLIYLLLLCVLYIVNIW